MKTFSFVLRIPREDLLAFYQGRSQRISVLADNGQRIELPAGAFRQFVDGQGLHGRFRVFVSDDHRLLELQRLDDPGYRSGR